MLVLTSHLSDDEESEVERCGPALLQGSELGPVFTGTSLGPVFTGTTRPVFVSEVNLLFSLSSCH